MKIVLAGTPEFSTRAFETVINEFEVVGIITQPDRPKGRGQQLIDTPVKQLATRYGIKVFQPKKIKDIEKELKSLDFDIFLTCAYGQIIPESILKIAKKGSLNIHASLLPKYRGAAPIHYSVLNGDKETGISLMYMVKAMDAGDVLFQEKTPIQPSYTTGQMFEILSIVASDHINDWLRKIEADLINPIKQDKNLVTLSPKITKEECQITDQHTTYQAERMIKAFNPFPGAFIMRDGIKYKIFNFGSDGIEFKTKDGILNITELQIPGKKIMNYKDFLKGNTF